MLPRKIKFAQICIWAQLVFVALAQPKNAFRLILILPFWNEMSKVHSFSDEEGDNTKFDFHMVVTMTNTVFCNVTACFW